MNINTIGQPQSIGTPQEIEKSGHSTVSEAILPASANALTPSDLSLISAATGAHFTQTPEGLQMVQYYNPDVSIANSDYTAALAQTEQDLKNNRVTNTPPAVVNQLALGGAEFQYALNFVNSIVSIRRSIGQNQPITPTMIINSAKQSNANKATIPEAYIASAIGISTV